MSNIHCGIGEIPKGKRLGNMRECAEKKQIRYYGLMKIDPKIIQASQSKKSTSSVNRSKLLVKLAEIDSKTLKLKKNISATKNEKEKSKLQKDMKKFIAQRVEIVTMLEKIDAKKKYGSKNKVSRSKSRNVSRSKSRNVSRSKSRSNSKKQKGGSKKTKSKSNSKPKKVKRSRSRINVKNVKKVDNESCGCGKW